MAKVKRSRGLGDTVEKIIHATGLQIFVEGKDCGCDKRKEKLNELFPYRAKISRCFTEQEHKEWELFKADRTLEMIFSSEVDVPQINFICELYASVFNRPIWHPCASCSPKPLKEMIDKLDKVFDSYE